MKIPSRFPQEVRRDKPTKERSNNGQLPGKHPVDWTDIHQSALRTLIVSVTNTPVMTYPDFQKPFVLHTDPQKDGLDAVFYQYQYDILRVVAYGSRNLTPAEKNYHLHSWKFESLALKWDISDQFRDYLYYAPSSKVFNDNNSLIYVLSSAKLNATSLHWIGELADYLECTLRTELIQK